MATKRIRSREEELERNALQYKEALTYRATAELMEGRELTDTEVFLWYNKIGLTKIFEVDWEEGRNPANLWYTGEEIHHPPTLAEGYRHWKEYEWKLVFIPDPTFAALVTAGNSDN